MANQEKPSQEMLENWHKDPKNWKWGLFYYNKEDNLRAIKLPAAELLSKAQRNLNDEAEQAVKEAERIEQLEAAANQVTQTPCLRRLRSGTPGRPKRNPGRSLCLAVWLRLAAPATGGPSSSPRHRAPPPRDAPPPTGTPTATRFLSRRCDRAPATAPSP